MAKLTITEALAEVKLIEKKLVKKRENVLANLSRYSHVQDPMQSDGGTTSWIEKEHQSMKDLQTRLEKIRSGIADANLKTEVTVGEASKSVFEWLTWKREVAPGYLGFLKQVHMSTKTALDQQNARPGLVTDSDGKQKLVELVLNVNYLDYLKQAEKANDLLEALDGQLSLKNATVLINV
jgi:hypothetical protein